MKRILIIATFILILLTGGIYIWQKNDTSDLQVQADAIKQAQEYSPEGNCTQAMVPAVHKSTGAKLTFNNGCLAPGWEAEN